MKRADFGEIIAAAWTRVCKFISLTSMDLCDVYQGTTGTAPASIVAGDIRIADNATPLSGTLTVNQGQTAVTGDANARFLTEVQPLIAQGAMIKVDSHNSTCWTSVESVTSDAQLTLVSPGYRCITASNVTASVITSSGVAQRNLIVGPELGVASGAAPGVYFESGLDNGITAAGNMPLPISLLSNAVRTQVIGSVVDGGLLDKGSDTRVLADVAPLSTDSRYYTKSGATKTLILTTAGMETGASKFTGTVSFGDSTISVPIGGTGAWQFTPGSGSNGNLGISLGPGNILFTTGNGALGNAANRWQGLFSTTADLSNSLTIGSGGTAITWHISATSGSLSFGTIPANSCASLTLTVTGAADGDSVSLGIPNALASTAGVTFVGWVSAADTVAVKACNVTTMPITPSSASVRADVWKH
ncbi:MAG: hypothetical protein HYR55_10230 [Acidobacteria bacterium]|nr:hypothetical protein [Acidobacteriota bacterium]